MARIKINREKETEREIEVSLNGNDKMAESQKRKNGEERSEAEWNIRKKDE